MYLTNKYGFDKIKTRRKLWDYLVELKSNY